MKKLAPGQYKLYRLLDYFGVALLMALLILIWQLYRGAIGVPFLKPYIIKALNHDDSQYQVTVDSVNLELVRSLRPLRIIANQVSYKKADGSIVVTAPRTSVSFSVKALLHGLIAPSAVDVYNPQIYIFTTYGIDKNKTEEINQKKLAYYFEQFDDFLERFNSEDQTYIESYINDINIIGAEVELHEVDLGKKWVLSDVNYRFERGFGKLETEISALLRMGGSSSSVGLEAVYRAAVNKLALQFYFADIVPDKILTLLAGDDVKLPFKVDVPLNGRIDGLINLKEIIKHRRRLVENLDAAVEKITFAVEGGQGFVAFSDNAEDNYSVGALSLNGELTGNLDKLEIKDAAVELDGQQAKVGVQAEGLKKYLLHSRPEDIALTLSAEVDSLATNDLYRYWPRQIAFKAWNWCKESMSEGEFRNGKFSFDFAYDKQAGGLRFKDLHGRAEAQGVSLNYLEGMPAIEGINGYADFAADSLKIYIDKGTSADVVANKGYVELYDLNKEDNFARIKIEGVGAIPDILRLIDHKPLGYTSDMGLKPDLFEGTADVSLDLDFELKQNLKPSEVKVDIKSILHDVVIKGMLPERVIEAKTLDLSVDNQGMLLSGVTNFDGIPITLEWKQNFDSRQYQSRYQLSFNFDNMLKQKLGLDISALSDTYIRGSIPAQAVVTTYADGKTIIDASGDLRQTDIDYSFLGFKKKRGVEGVISARIELRDGKVKNIPMFALSKPDFNLSGNISLNKQGQIEVIDIADIKGPKTSAAAKIAMGDKIKIDVTGVSYDLSDFFAKDEEEIERSKARRRQKKLHDALEPPAADENQWEKVADADINITVDNLWTNENVAIRNFVGETKVRHGIGIEEMHLTGHFAAKANRRKESGLRLDYVPRANQEYLLTIESDDAGSTFRFLRLYDDMRGGTLSISARRTPDKNFIGYAKIRDFNVYNTPVFAKLLTVASLSGMVDLLTGEGIVFSHFDAPFEYRNSQLKVNDARAFGNVVGISGSGTYSMRYQEFDVKGLIAPAYGLNTLIGSIPLVGSLLSGKDGTVFAANYSISGNIDEPEININPLSALSPNSLKELVSSVFGDDK